MIDPMRRLNGSLSLCLFALALLLSPTAAEAVPVGVLSFDNLIPADLVSGVPGVNGYVISNLTGDPLTGGASNPPAFPVLTALTFMSSTLTLDPFGGPPIALGDIGPGPFLDLVTSLPPDQLLFPDTTGFSSAAFTGTLSDTVFLLADGTTFVAASSQISATLLPSTPGGQLFAGLGAGLGSDFVVIDVPGTAGAAVPEPGSLLLLAGGLAALWAWTGKKGMKAL